MALGKRARRLGPRPGPERLHADPAVLAPPAEVDEAVVVVRAGGLAPAVLALVAAAGVVVGAARASRPRRDASAGGRAVGAAGELELALERAACRAG